MMLALFSIAVAVLLGLAAGGGMSSMVRWSYPGTPTFIGLFVLQAVARGRGIPQFLGPQYALSIWALVVVILVLMLLSVRELGVQIVAAGIASNLLVVLANGAMPIAFEAMRVLGAGDRALGQGEGFYTCMLDGALFQFLGDSIPVPNPFGGGFLVSVGDLLLVVGVVVFVVRVMTEPYPGAGPRPVSE